jgi:hypothetical protein
VKRHKVKVAEHQEACIGLQKAIVPEQLRDVADERHRLLSGVPDWCNAAAVPFHRASSCKSFDWKQLMQWAAGYVFAGILPPHIEEAFFKLVGVLNEILEATADVKADDDFMTSRDYALEELKLKAVRALVAIEECVPKTDSGPIVLHIIPHVVESIYRWNSVRNFWAFFTER